MIVAAGLIQAEQAAEHDGRGRRLPYRSSIIRNDYFFGRADPGGCDTRLDAMDTNYFDGFNSYSSCATVITGVTFSKSIAESGTGCYINPAGFVGQLDSNGNSVTERVFTYL